MDILNSTIVFLIFISLSVSFPTGPPAGACVSRTPNHRPHQMSTDCLYALYSDKWEPGAAVRMAIFHDSENVTFRGFLASIYHDDVPVGEMSLEGVRTEPRQLDLQPLCEGTSMTHTENSDKYLVSFNWIAPSDLELDAELVVRLSVVASYSEFYVDCRPYLLVPKSTTPETTATVSTIFTESTIEVIAPVVTTEEVTTPAKERPDGTGIDYTGQEFLKHEVISDVSCQEGGNVYTVVRGTNCKEFVQHSPGKFARGVTHRCQGWSRFSAKLCSCAYISVCVFP